MLTHHLPFLGPWQQSAEPSGAFVPTKQQATATELQTTSHALTDAAAASAASIAGTQLCPPSAPAANGAAPMTGVEHSVHQMAPPKVTTTCDEHHSHSPAGADTPSPAETHNLLTPITNSLAGVSSLIAGGILWPTDAGAHEAVGVDTTHSAAVFDGALSKTALQVDFKIAQHAADPADDTVAMETCFAAAVSSTLHPTRSSEVAFKAKSQCVSATEKSADHPKPQGVCSPASVTLHVHATATNSLACLTVTVYVLYILFGFCVIKFHIATYCSNASHMTACYRSSSSPLLELKTTHHLMQITESQSVVNQCCMLHNLEVFVDHWLSSG